MAGEARPLEECYVCGKYTGRAGRADDSIYCECGAGPFCEECWDGHWCLEREATESMPFVDDR